MVLLQVDPALPFGKCRRRLNYHPIVIFFDNVKKAFRIFQNKMSSLKQLEDRLQHLFIHHVGFCQLSITTITMTTKAESVAEIKEG